MDSGQIRQLALELAEAAVLQQVGKRLSIQPDGGGLQTLSDDDHAALARVLAEIAEAVANDTAARVLAELGRLNDALLLQRDSIAERGPRETGRRLGLEEAAGMVRSTAARLGGPAPAGTGWSEPC